MFNKLKQSILEKKFDKILSDFIKNRAISQKKFYQLVF